MKPTGRWLAFAATAAGLGAGLAAQHSAVRRRHLNDPEADELFGERRGTRERTIGLSDGTRIFVTEAGPRLPVAAVFVHGSALRSDVWHYQMPGLGPHRLIFYDLRGHGRSQPVGSHDFSIARLAEDLLEVMDACGLEEAVIVGHSIGGMVALHLCREHPELMHERVKGLVLANTTYRPPLETLAGGAAVARLERVTRRPLDALAPYGRPLEMLRKVIRPSDSLFMAVSFAAFGPNASAKQIDFTYDMLAETPINVIFDLLKCYRTFDVTEHLDGISVPALVISGGCDRLTLPRASEHLARALPRARLVLFDDCGHQSMLERHTDFNSEVQRFLDEVLATPAPASEVGAAAQGRQT